MIKTIKDGYIIAFAPEFEGDSEYNRLKEIFINHGEADDGMTWVMSDDESMVQIPLQSSEPDVEPERALAEIQELLGVN